MFGAVQCTSLIQKYKTVESPPRWHPKSRSGIFLGYSPTHSSDVTLVLNPTKGHISPQYHVVFDDTFSIIQYIYDDKHPPLFWNNVAIDSFIHQVPLVPGNSIVIHDEWLTPAEWEEKGKFIQLEYHIHASYIPSLSETDSSLA